MDDDIPPEDDPASFTDDSENFSEDEFPEKSSGEEKLDEDFQVSDIPNEEHQEKTHVHDEKTSEHNKDNDHEEMGAMGDESQGFDKPTSDSTRTSMEEVSLDQVDVSKIPIRIDLELTRVRVSLSELQKMEPGQRLPIDVNPRLVNLVTGGKIIGKGEVVDIGDSSCIKILKLYK